MGARVCMVVHEHFPRDFRVRREARALEQAGFEVTVVSLKQPGQRARERLDGLEVVRLPIKRHRGSPLPVYLSEYLAFAALASACVASLHAVRRFDVVQVHTPPDFLVSAGLMAQVSGARLVLDIHDLTPELYASRFKGAGGRAARFLCERTEWISCALANRVITTTEAFRDLLVQRGVLASKILVLHNCPDPAIFYPQPAIPGGDGFTFIHHGTILHRYGQDILLEAFARVAGELPKARLEIYGDGDLLPRLRRRVEKPDLAGRVVLHGEVPQERIAGALVRADLCVVPNRTDAIMELAFPTKLLEAIQMGCPVVASATRLVADTFTSGGIRLVPPGEVEPLAAAMLELASDPGALRNLASEGSRQAERFSWAREKQKLIELYTDLCTA